MKKKARERERERADAGARNMSLDRASDEGINGSNYWFKRLPFRKSVSKVDLLVKYFTFAGDKALEEKVEERYLLRFRNLYDFRCRIDARKEDNVEEGVSVNEPQKTSSNRTQLLTSDTPLEPDHLMTHG